MNTWVMSGDVIVPESDGSYWIEEIDVENPEDEIPLDNIQSGMMYGAYSADTLSTRSSDSSINRNNTTGFFFPPSWRGWQNTSQTFGFGTLRR